MIDLKKRALFLFDFLRAHLPVFYDFYLELKTVITKENFIGVYVGICNASEIRLWYKNCVGGGYTWSTLIKLFVQPNCENCEECAEEIINHEVLHQVLSKVEGPKAKETLDNIHKAFYVYNCTTKKWEFIIKFAYEKKTTKTVTII